MEAEAANMRISMLMMRRELSKRIFSSNATGKGY
jgi:hypothetical protein